MQSYLDKKQLATHLSISQKTLQKELKQAINDGCEAVIKISNIYRIEPKGFISYLVNKNKSKEVDIKCQEKDKIHSKREMEYGMSTIMIERQKSESASQLKQILGI